jgi:membrane-associated phospholipid phosphatase
MDRLVTTLADRRWPLLALFCGVLGPLWIFGALAEGVRDRAGFAWDVFLLRAIHGYATPSRDAVMMVITGLGGAQGMAPLCALALLVLLVRRRPRAALFLALAYGGALVLNGLGKLVFHRARPTLWVSPAPADGYGFPSTHAMGSMALLAALVVLAWPTRWHWPAGLVGGLVVAVVGFSRLYLGVHYPSDVVAAWAAALAWVVGLHLVLAARVPRPWLRHTQGHHAGDGRGVDMGGADTGALRPCGDGPSPGGCGPHTSGQAPYRAHHGACGRTMPCGGRGRTIRACPGPCRWREREPCGAKSLRALVLVENPRGAGDSGAAAGRPDHPALGLAVRETIPLHQLKRLSPQWISAGSSLRMPRPGTSSMPPHSARVWPSPRWQRASPCASAWAVSPKGQYEHELVDHA